MRINTNVAALTALENNSEINKQLNESLSKLSSGLNITKASDDASGLAIADKLRTQAASISQSISNGNSAVALIQIADKAMAEQSNILDIIKQKLIQAATATTSPDGRDAIAKDINKLLEQLDNVASQTNYNGNYLLQASNTNTSTSSKLIFQMGELSTNDITAKGNVQANVTGLSLTNLQTVTANTGFSQSGADAFMLVVDTAINRLNTWRADFGSTQNQLESALRNMATQYTNIKSAESVIRDVDYAVESANFNKSNIISQAGTYALSQSNNVTQNILKLLQ